jgi:hypothetical protein
MTFEFKNAFYIKLGKGGAWESDAIKNSRLRFGWVKQSSADINNGNWATIEEQLRTDESIKNKQVATTSLNGLRKIAESTSEDIWITFHESKLWWVRLSDEPVKEDEISKYRTTLGHWQDKSLTGSLLFADALPGKIASLQGFRWTICNIKEPELLQRVIQGSRSELANLIAKNRFSLCQQLEVAITALHWKDYETLVDLIFRHSGWQRLSVLGQQAKGYDLLLSEPILNQKIIVQIKSQADCKDLENTVQLFSKDDYHKIFFVVHSPAPSLKQVTNIPDHVEIVDPGYLAKLALSAGLTDWIEGKVA